MNVDFVADAIATLHQKENPHYDTYHLSSGVESQTLRQFTAALAAAQNKRAPILSSFFATAFQREGKFSLQPERISGI